MYVIIPVYIALFFMIELLYFHFAHRLQIIDKPNVRSSHTIITIRGGGIIFPIAALLSWSYESPEDFMCSMAVLLMAVLSFIDDIRTLRSDIRLFVQLVSIVAVAYSFATFMSWPYILLLIFVFIGIVNSYNFMDGINSITALYSLIAVGTLFWIHKYITPIYTDKLFLALLSAILVFAWFNCRKDAKAFAGDVGSVSIAMIICILLLNLILTTRHLNWVCLLGIYGIDVCTTIVCRISRRESLLAAHRSHFYQYLANEKKISHLNVSILYVSCQFLLNVSVIWSYKTNLIWLPWFILSLFISLYIAFRLKFEGHQRLFHTY